MPRWSLYGVFARREEVPVWGMTTNKRDAIKAARKARGYVTRMDYPRGPGTGTWDAPTFRVCSDLVADFREQEKN